MGTASVYEMRMAKPTTVAPAGRRRRMLLIGGALILGVPLVGMSLSLLFGKSDPPLHKRVVQIALIAPAPPPPPPPKPPEEQPKPKEEVKLDEPKPTPEEPKPMAQDPAAGPLGIDAQGTGPGDSFGLAGRPGGRDITTTGGLGFRLFGANAAREIAQDLARNPRLKTSVYRVEILVWIGKDGQLVREQIVRGTGDAELDAAISDGLHQISSVRTAVPDKLPQPLRIRVTSADA